MNFLIILLSCISLLLIICLIFILIKWQRSASLSNLEASWQGITKNIENLEQQHQFVLKEVREHQQTHTRQAHQHQLENVKLMRENMQEVQSQLLVTVKERLQAQNENLLQLQKAVDQRLEQINGRVEERLQQGFEKTNLVFSDVLKRLALIDQAQKKITELSQSVMSLQEILADKRARGAFGEIQLTALIRNLIPENHFSLQHELSNKKRCDCILFLPPPTGSIVIDSKFPLETYQKLTNPEINSLEKKEAERQFKIDIKKHIYDIAEKYIIPNETAEGAIMFIPAEAIFAEIHSYHPELVNEAQRAKVWITSPTTLMAVLTTARAVLKDAATQKQVHIIQQHLQELAKDFKRFQDRMDNLGKHIDQVHQDVKSVQTSATKISNRFNKIDQVELPESIILQTAASDEKDA